MNSPEAASKPGWSFSPAQIWRLDPRDPAVLGDGRNGLAFVEGGTWAFPYPGTVAGMVRSNLLKDEPGVTPDRARVMLEQVRIRGPWLVEPALRADDNEHETALRKMNPSCLRVPAPADVRLNAKTLLGATIKEPVDGEGALWSIGTSNAALPGLCILAERRDNEDGKGAQKLDALVDQHWPFSLAVLWNLGIRPKSAPSGDFQKLAELAVSEATDKRCFLHREQRMHVVIDDDRGTAQAGLLFSSGGLRLEDGWALAFEVSCPATAAAATEKQLTLLGGESRPSYLEVIKHDLSIAGAFPDFNAHRKLYKQHAEGARGLRLQLLSPAFLPTRTKNSLYHDPGDPAWCPSWLNPSLAHREPHPAVRELLQSKDLELRLHAVCIPGYAVVSGWNMQGGNRRQEKPSARVTNQRTGASREVRRLVPAGSVYYLDLFRDGERLTDTAELARLLPALCEQLWGGFIDPEGPGESLEALRDEFRAPAAYDGYGLILPGYWSGESNVG